MAERLAARPEVMERRRTSVEHPFGSIKQSMGQGAFLTRRLVNVRGEFSLTALAYNMRRAINLVGIPALIAARSPLNGWLAPFWPRDKPPTPRFAVTATPRATETVGYPERFAPPRVRRGSCSSLLRISDP